MRTEVRLLARLADFCVALIQCPMYNPKFIEDNNFYSFRFSNGFTYDIPKESISSNEQLNEWLLHLKSKIWFTEKLESDFVSSAVFTYK